jgi:hypothetical protein
MNKFQLIAHTELELLLTLEMEPLVLTEITVVHQTMSQIHLTDQRKIQARLGPNIQSQEKLVDIRCLTQTLTMNNQELFGRKFSQRPKELLSSLTYLDHLVELEEISKKVSLLTFTKFIQTMELDSLLPSVSHSIKLECEQLIQIILFNKKYS